MEVHDCWPEMLEIHLQRLSVFIAGCVTAADGVRGEEEQVALCDTSTCTTPIQESLGLLYGRDVREGAAAAAGARREGQPLGTVRVLLLGTQRGRQPLGALVLLLGPGGEAT